MFNLNPKQLYQFQILAELGNTAKACAFLGISQPALTQSLNRLESQLKVELFDRSTRPPKLTINGHHLLKYTRKLQLETENLYDRLEFEQGGYSSVIRFGCGARWMVDIIPRIVQQFSIDYPDTRLSICVAQMEELNNLLDNGQISFMFGTTNRMRRFTHHNITEVGRDRFAVVARSSHPLQKQKNISLEVLTKQRWVIGDPSASSSLVLRKAMLDAGIAPVLPAIELSDTLAAANIIREGDFLGIFTNASVRGLPEIETLSIDFELPESISGAISLEGHKLNEAEEALIERVREAFTE